MTDQTSMIAGSKVEYSTDEGTDYIEINGIQQLPDFREETGEREVTAINNTVRQYDNDMDSPTEQDLSAFYLKNDAEQLAFRALARNKGTCLMRVTYADGDALEFSCSLKNYGINGGDAPSTKMWTTTIRRTSKITHTEATS